MNRLDASRAFLFMPRIVGAKGEGQRSSIFSPLIPLLGVVLCPLVLVAILTAVSRSQQWRAKIRQGAYSGEGGRGAFSIVVPRSPAIPHMGAIGVPAEMVATWLYPLLAPPVVA